MYTSAAMHFSHVADTDGREDTQVSSSIIWSPSACVVQQPVSSRALKTSLINSERSAGTWNIMREKSHLNVPLCKLSSLSFGSTPVYVMDVHSIMQTSRLLFEVQGSVLIQMSVNARSPWQQGILNGINGNKTAVVYFIYEACIVNKVIFMNSPCWQRSCCILHDFSPWYCMQ